MRRLGFLLLAVLLVAPETLAAPSVPGGFRVTTRRQLDAGVEYLVMARSDNPAVAHVAHIAPGAPVDLRAVSSYDRIPHQSGDLELPSGMCKRVHCLVGVNGDFHDLSSKEPLGGVAASGYLLRSPAPPQSQVSLTRDGRLLAGLLDWAATLGASDGTSLALNGLNRSSEGDQLVLYTPTWGSTTDTSGDAELVLRAGGPVGALNRATVLEAVELRNGPGSIPADGAVLSGTGAAEVTVRELWTRISQGRAAPGLRLQVTSPVDVLESLGVHPRLLHEGRPVFPPGTDGFTTSRHPRTLVGWNPAGEILLVAVDGRQSDSMGMSLAEAADLLLGLGATEGVNFDGGGGTTFVVGGSVANRPSGDNNEERGAPNALVLVPRPELPAPAPAPPPPASAGPAPIAPRSEPAPVAPRRSGYWMVGSDGRVYAFGNATHLGDATPHLQGIEAVDIEPTPSFNGYWIVDRAGRVFSFGDARYFGNADMARLAPGERVTSLSATPTGGGYWMFTDRGRVLVFGDARHFGDMSAVALNGPVLDSIPTPTGRGYYMVAADGGIFAFGDARFHGSMGGKRLNAPVQSLVPDPDGVGYWLVASDGGVFAFEAPFRGSMGSTRLNRPVTGMVPFGNGYLMVGEDGGIFNFSDRAFHGSLGSNPPGNPIVAVAAL